MDSYSESLDSTLASFTAAIRSAKTARARVDFSGEAAIESGVRMQALSKYCRVSPQCWHPMTLLCSIGLISPVTSHGRARMILPQAAQCVCPCRYGAALFSLVSASRFDGDGQGTLQTAGRLRVADCAEGLHRHGRYAVREGRNVRPTVLAPDEGFAVSEYGKHEVIIGEYKANTQEGHCGSRNVRPNFMT